MHIKHAKRRKMAQKVADPTGIATYNQKEVSESFPGPSVPGDCVAVVATVSGVSVGKFMLLERVESGIDIIPVASGMDGLLTVGERIAKVVTLVGTAVVNDRNTRLLDDTEVLNTAVDVTL